MRQDPRWYQMLFLSSLLALGVFWKGFPVSPHQIALTFGAGLATQYFFLRRLKIPQVGYRSAIISCFSLCLLLRCDAWWVAPLAAVAAMSSKFLLRSQGRALFNPANFGVVLALLLSGKAWCSPGQWGHGTLMAAWIIALGTTVVWRAARQDVSWAFLAFYLGLIFLRVYHLGQRPAVFWHQLENGSLLLFTFFMISDPKSIPASRSGRFALAAAVALFAFFWQYHYYHYNGLFYGLFLLTPVSVLWDKYRPAPAYAWDTGGVMKKSLAAVAVSLLAFAPRADAFCGFYVGKADAKLYNKASQVVLVRDGNRTAISMANDYKGELTEFAIVIPVPVVLKKEQVHVGEQAQFERIDAYSSPRLVEYFDENPCEQRRVYEMMAPVAAARGAGAATNGPARAKALGVTIEASYTVGEYDIVILGAKQSDGLETWLHESGYSIPAGAARALKPYIGQGLKFFVAKVNLKEQAKTGFQGLRPIQFAYEDSRFMLPIRLGMINANGPQDLIVYVLTKNGRVETTNYRTLKVPSDMEIPDYVKADFGDFYKAMFGEAVKRENGRAVFTEYFWDMNWCDPCAADPLSHDELRKLGVFWLSDNQAMPMPAGRPFMPRRGPWNPGGGAAPVKITRLHVRYDAEHFPEDLVFQETPDTANFQGRYILRHFWQGDANQCPAAGPYLENVRRQKSTQAETLARLTGWDINQIHDKMQLGKVDPQPQWYDQIFK